MTTKATFIVTDIDFRNYANGDTAEYKSEKAALTAAKELLNGGYYDTALVWRLSHIISKPNVEPDIEKVK